MFIYWAHIGKNGILPQNNEHIDFPLVALHLRANMRGVHPPQLILVLDRCLNIAGCVQG